MKLQSEETFCKRGKTMNCTLNKGLVSKIYKKLNSKTTKILLKMAIIPKKTLQKINSK